MFSMMCAVAPAIAAVIGIVCAIAGVGLGVILYKVIATKKIGKSKSNAVKIIEEAYAEAKTIKKEAIIDAKEEAQKIKDDANSEAKERRNEIQKSEERLDQREEYITKKESSIDAKLDQIEKEKTAL